jgi:hypothetical protein
MGSDPYLEPQSTLETASAAVGQSPEKSRTKLGEGAAWLLGAPES